MKNLTIEIRSYQGPIKLKLASYAFLGNMEEQWTDQERMDFARTLIDTVESKDVFLELFNDRCKYCGQNLKSFAGPDKKCYCQDTPKL